MKMTDEIVKPGKNIPGNGRAVTVCDACLQASCWQGLFFCNKAHAAGTVERSVEELIKLDLEHPSYWK